jgi:hypothetical protein
MAMFLSVVGCDRNNMDWMDDCIEVQCGLLYIEYMRETLDYNITIIPLTITPLTPPPPQMQ